MKKFVVRGALLLLMSVCTAAAPKMEVNVSNPLAVDRDGEVVEMVWGDVTGRLAGATPENVVVMDAAGVQVPSQVVYAGDSVPQTLIFLAAVPASGNTAYTVGVGVCEPYRVMAYGRYVPERLDDYAWENNMAAYRLYGPALETAPGEMLVTPGIDVWVKSTERMVIDERYKRGHYHDNHGDGMDCYKVGRTLGGGASAPFVDGRLWLSGNYAAQERLDNGPLRTTVRLTYAPFAAGEDTVSLVKYITLDANTPFSQMTNVYMGNFETLPVAGGLVMHGVKGRYLGADAVAITEAASDSKQPDADSDISLAVIMPAADTTLVADGHILAVGTARPGIPLVYYAGSAWSGAGVKDIAAWKAVVEASAEKIAHPLVVAVVPAAKK